MSILLADEKQAKAHPKKWTFPFLTKIIEQFIDENEELLRQRAITRIKARKMIHYSNLYDEKENELKQIEELRDKFIKECRDEQS